MLWLPVVCPALCAYARARDGRFTLIPVSAPDMVPEAVLPATAENNVVSIGAPSV